MTAGRGIPKTPVPVSIATVKIIYENNEKKIYKTPKHVSYRLFHLSDVQLDMRVHLQELIMSAVNLILDVFFQIDHLCASQHLYQI